MDISVSPKLTLVEDSDGGHHFRQFTENVGGDDDRRGGSAPRDYRSVVPWFLNDERSIQGASIRNWRPRLADQSGDGSFPVFPIVGRAVALLRLPAQRTNRSSSARPNFGRAVDHTRTRTLLRGTRIPEQVPRRSSPAETYPEIVRPGPPTRPPGS